MICKYITMGSRYFLRAGDHLIPVDDIKEINLESVDYDHREGETIDLLILTMKDGQEYKFKNDKAKALRAFLTNNNKDD